MGLVKRGWLGETMSMGSFKVVEYFYGDVNCWALSPLLWAIVRWVFRGMGGHGLKELNRGYLWDNFKGHGGSPPKDPCLFGSGTALILQLQYRPR